MTIKNSGRLAPLVIAAAIVVTACGGRGTPHVASLGKSADRDASTATDPGTARGSGRGTSTTTLPTGTPTQLLDEWAACMRTHGDPDQVDPTIDSNKVIHITISPAIQGGYYGYSGEYGSGGPGVYCRVYVNAAQTELEGGQAPKQPDQATLEKFSQCMRSNGISDFPDPTSNGLSIRIQPGSDLDPNNPTFQRASKVCARKTGVEGFGGGTPPPGSIRLNGEGGPGGAGASSGNG